MRKSKSYGETVEFRTWIGGMDIWNPDEYAKEKKKWRQAWEDIWYNQEIKDVKDEFRGIEIFQGPSDSIPIHINTQPRRLRDQPGIPSFANIIEQIGQIRNVRRPFGPGNWLAEF